mmetsp:Transcript_8150/g.20199  ORF Transcript_8150/g.20199 Transcript_8150/m.20199 type:complete len:343 (+) Transcript_8150:551-1579(+)
MLHRTMFRGDSTPSGASQSRTTAHWVGKSALASVGKPEASMPAWMWMKLFRSGMPPVSSSVLTRESMYSCALVWSLPSDRAPDNILFVTYGSAFDTTACFALMTCPFSSFTPTALSSSIRISETGAFRQTFPLAFFRTPRTSASTMLPLPPLGKSRTTPGRYQSASMYAITAFMVPLAGNPCNKKHNMSNQFLTNLSFRSISSMILLKGSLRACPCWSVAKSSLGYRSSVKTAPASSRNAMEVRACAAFERGSIRSMSAANSASAFGPPCSLKTSPNSSGPIFAANFRPSGITVPQRSYVSHSASSPMIWKMFFSGLGDSSVLNPEYNEGPDSKWNPRLSHP